MFQNMGLRNLSYPKRDEVTGEWRKLHNEELNDLYFLTNIIRVVKSLGPIARMEETNGAYRVFVERP